MDADNEGADEFVATNAAGEQTWTGSRVDLAVRLQLRAARGRGGLRSDDAEEKFVHDFVAAWTQVMEADRFDLA